MVRGLLLALLGLAMQPVLAWGHAGHRIVAELAWTQLTPQARAGVDRLLALEPGASLASVASWADDNRDDATRTWHFVNFPKGACIYDPQRDCPGGQCIIAAFDRQIAILASSVPDAERLVALKYVVHLAADVHQPLHGGHFDDRGGNRYQLQVSGDGTNLHALWDSGLLQMRRTRSAALVGTVAALAQASQLADRSLIQAAQESCALVDAPDFYPPRTLPADYVAHFGPLMEQRLALAGARLAGWLNRVMH
ncbi:MAG: S1/P1 nuclease [Burkholderiaceae bacterium]